jgi:hypothetical protein
VQAEPFGIRNTLRFISPMDTTFSSSPDPDFGTGAPGGSAESDAKRRKVRKGTRSCWECKRRKIRCVFDCDADALCVGCQRRGTSCVSQEFPEEHAEGGGRVRQMGDRIVRVEALVEQLVKKVGGNGAGTQGRDARDQIRRDSSRAGTASGSPSAGSSGNRNPSAGILTPDDSGSDSARLFSVYNTVVCESFTLSDISPCAR